MILSDMKKAALKALDAVEELRQMDAEENKGYLDHEYRVICAHIAEGAGIPNRADWTDLLRQDPTTKYYKRYNGGTFHI